MSTGSSSINGLPRLAFVYHPRSFGTMAIAEAAEGICELLWVLDTAVPEVSSMSRLLRRLGTVIDVAGLSIPEATEAIAGSRPDGILALADSLLVWTAQVASRLDLPFLSPEVAERLTDKYLQRDALQRSGLPVPGFWRIPAEDDESSWVALEQVVRFPAVLKPRQGEGSRDIVRVRSFSELRALVSETASGSEAEPSKLVLEEYLADRPEHILDDFADYVSVESVVSDTHISHLAITGRFPPADPFRETGFFIPSAFNKDDCAAIVAVATAAVGAIGVSDGVLHTEIKLTPDGPRVIELNGRIGGGVPEMLNDASGVELLRIALQVALGEPIVFAEIPQSEQVGFLLYVQAPQAMSRIHAVEGLDRLREHAGVLEVILNRGAGSAVDWRSGNHGHVFSVRGAVPSHEELRSLERYVSTEVQIRGA